MSLTKLRQIDQITNNERGTKVVNDYYLKLPVAETITRPGEPVAPDPEPGMMRYNSLTKNMEVFLEDKNGGAQWLSIGLGSEPVAPGEAAPQGDMLHRFGDIMYGDLRLANGSQAANASTDAYGTPHISDDGGAGSNSRLLNSDGTETDPSYTFDLDRNTGIYRPADNTIALNVEGFEAIRIAPLVDLDPASRTNTIVTVWGDFAVMGNTTNIDTVNLVIEDNIILLNKNEAGIGVTAGVSGIEIERGPATDNAGWYYNETKNWWGPTGPSGSLVTGTGATQTLGNIQEIDTRDAVDSGKFYIDGDSLRLRGIGQRGTALFPSYSWDDDQDTGMYSPLANEVALTTNGIERLIVSNTAITFTVPTTNINGIEAAPAYSFTSDLDTGMWLNGNGSGDLQFSTSGTSRLELRDTEMHINVQTKLIDGTSVSPALTFQANTNLGLWRETTDTLGITSAGSGNIFVNANGLGVGIQATERFHVASDGNGNGVALFTDTDAGTALHEIKIGLANAIDSNITVGYDDANNFGYVAVDGELETTALVIDNSGRIGIGERPDVGTKLQSLGVVKHYFSDASRPSIQMSADAADPLLDFYRFDTGTAYDGTRFIQDNDLFRIQTGPAASIGSHTWTTALTVNQTEQLLLTDGSATNPSLSFETDVNTGLYRDAEGTVGLTTNGVVRVLTSDTKVITHVQQEGIDGSQSAPTYSFVNDTNSGFYSTGVDSIGISTGGLERATISSTGVTKFNNSVGIEKTASNGMLDLANDGIKNPLAIDSHASTTEIYISGSSEANIASDNGVNPFYIQNLGAGSINLQTTATDRLVIDSIGDVRINSITDHNGKLTVKSTTAEQHIILEQENSTTDGWGLRSYGAAGGSFEINRMTSTTTFVPHLTISTSGNTTLSNDLTVTGNLIITGTTTTVNSTVVEVADNIIKLNRNEVNSGVTLGSAGIEIDRGLLANVSWLWDETSNYWTPSGGNIGNVGIITSTTFNGALNGNALTADALLTARNITLSGDVTGTASFDGSANIIITSTVVDDSHTHDTQYYTKALGDVRYGQIATPSVYTAQQNFGQVTLTDGANILWNLNSSQSAILTMINTITTRQLDNPTNQVAGGTYVMLVKQDATGGAALTYDTAYKFSLGTPVVISTGVNAVDILTFISDGTNMYCVAQQNFS